MPGFNQALIPDFTDQALRKEPESIHAAEPNNRESGIKLALIGEVDGALALLEPAADQLGDGEGARLTPSLGGMVLQIY